MKRACIPLRHDVCLSAPREDMLARHRCLGDDGTLLIVLESRYSLHGETSAGPRAYPGARFWTLESGEAVRVLDRRTFEVVTTGELLILTGS
jgi:hypothetical protein